MHWGHGAPGASPSRREDLVVAVDDVDGAARAPEPGPFDLSAVVGTAHAALGGSRRVVGDDVAGLGEAADHEEMTVRAMGGGALQGPAGVGDGGDEGDARIHEPLRVAEV